MSEWNELATSIVDLIKSNAQGFLDNNQSLKDLLEDRAEELAKLSAEYVSEVDAAKQAAILTELKIVKQTIVNELGTLALNGQTAAIATFKSVVDTAISSLIKYLPVILAHI